MKNTALSAECRSEPQKRFLTADFIFRLAELREFHSKHSQRKADAASALEKTAAAYLDKNGLRENQAAIWTIMHCLPYSYPQYKLRDEYFKLTEKQGEQEVDDETVLPEEVRKRLTDLGSQYSESQKKVSDTEKEMRKHINFYLDQQDLWSNPKAILEVIEQLPEGYLRFNFYETYYELVEKE